MSVINWLLIYCAETFLWLWDGIVWLFGVVFSWIDAILNPILSPALAYVNPVCTFLGDAAFAVLDRLPFRLGLALVSVVAGVVMLLAFRRFSNQEAIGRAKDDIKANLLALRLFKDDLRVMMRCQVRVLWAIVRLQRYVLTPVLWMTPPMLLVLAQMGLRYQWRPLRPNEPTLMRVTSARPAVELGSMTLEPCAGLMIEAGPVPGGNTAVWRIRGAAPGRYSVRIRVVGETIEKELVVGDRPGRVSAVRPTAHWTDQLFHPVERPLAGSGVIQRMEIEYPSSTSWYEGADYWIVTFFVVSMLTALILAPILRVRF